MSADAAEAREAGALSSSGRVSTKRRLSDLVELMLSWRETNSPLSYSDSGTVAVPDTTWAGLPDPYKCVPGLRRVNSSLAGQNKSISSIGCTCRIFA